MTDALLEYGLDCPHCGEPITLLLDLSAADQAYVEDCEVCCNPLGIRLRVEDGEVVAFEASPTP